MLKGEVNRKGPHYGSTDVASQDPRVSPYPEKDSGGGGGTTGQENTAKTSN